MPWTWSWHAHPDVWVLAVALYGGYRWALARVGPKRLPPGTPVATAGQRRAFALGVVAILIASEWPVHDLAEGYLYSVHMVQHLLLTLAASPLLMVGIPSWLARALLPPPVMRVVRALTRPLVALILFNTVLVFTHWPMIVEASVRSEITHFGLHVLIVGSALVMWTPVLSPTLELPRLAYPGQMMYLFLQSLVPTVPASFLTFGDRPLYAIYESFPRIWGISALADQRTAGLIMKIAGGLMLWAVIAAVFFRWFSMEQEDGVDALAWSDVDRSLNRMELKTRG